MIIFFKILYGIYFGGIMVYGAHLVSMLLFSRIKFSSRLGRFIRGAFISIAWPLMVLSSGGIKILRKNINKF